MDKRLFLAIALSSLVLLTWSAITNKFYPIANKEVIENTPAQVKTLPAPAALPVSETAKEIGSEPPSSSLIKLAQGKYEITFIEPQAAIKEIAFPSYQSYKFSLKRGFLLGDKNLFFKKEGISENSITFVCQDKDKKITKRFIFSNTNYNIELEITVLNLSSTPLHTNIILSPAVLVFSKDQNEARFQGVTLTLPEKTLYLNGLKSTTLQEVKFLSWHNRYFCGIVEPEGSNYTGFINKIGPQESEIVLSSKEFLLSTGQEIRQKFSIYLGPQELQFIKRVKPEWAVVVNYGTFDFISHLLLDLLGFLYRIMHNWGLAIVLLGIIIYFIFYPLTLKQMRSMKQMQSLQPQIEELKTKYKDNPQKLNKAIMELYRENKVNPLGGCLPLILQIPIFFALYQALMRSVALKGANFLWIKDLSEPDRLFILPVSLPMLGNEVNILPVLMAIGMFLQQKFSTRASAGGVSQEQQKLMLFMLPIMFGFIFYHMPAGLVLYWFTNGLLMLIYQIRISRVR